MSDPKLIANFILDQTGRPKAIEEGDKRHYLIRLAIAGAPKDTYAVTYKLDESYQDPMREARNAAEEFSEELTSYGDYPVLAQIRTKLGVEPVSAALSQALELGNQGKLTPEIQDALDNIRNH